MGKTKARRELDKCMDACLDCSGDAAVINCSTCQTAREARALIQKVREERRRKKECTEI